MLFAYFSIGFQVVKVFQFFFTSNIARTYLFQLVAAEQVFNAQGLDVNGKIEKLKELATAYGQSAIAAKIAHMEDQNAKAHTSFTDSDYQMLIDEVNNAVNNVQIDFQGVGGKKSAGTAGKEAADTYLEAFEKELKDLDDLKSDGKISEKQSLDALVCVCMYVHMCVCAMMHV